jgi:hypothetical protein
MERKAGTPGTVRPKWRAAKPHVAGAARALQAIKSTLGRCLCVEIAGRPV